MNFEEGIRIVFSFLGGGLVAAILSWVKDVRSEKSTRRNERVRAQLENLYGPLYFFSSQNDTLFDLVRKIHGAYQEEYSSKNWSPSEHTQANLKKELDATIQLANSYVRTAISNGTAMVDALRANYAHVDPDDEEIFREFVLDQERLKQEFPAGRPMRTPFRIYKQIGEISFMRPEYSARVRDKFLAKKRFLEGARGIKK